jgi:nucleoside-diphosphate-sugar epimerase
MKVIVIGATGTIGKAIVQAIADRHEVITVSRSKTAVTVDLADQSSIVGMYQATGRVDAVICAAGLAAFGPFGTLTDRDYELGIGN